MDLALGEFTGAEGALVAPKGSLVEDLLIDEFFIFF